MKDRPAVSVFRILLFCDVFKACAEKTSAVSDERLCMKKITENPYGLFGEGASASSRDAAKAVLLPALLSTLVFFPVLQILMANGAPGVLYYIIYYVNQLFTLFFFMLVFSFSFLFMRHMEEEKEKKLSRLFLAVQFFIVFLLRLGVFLLGALIDDKLAIDFYFSNVTFDGLMANGGASFVVQGVFMFINSFALVVLVYFLSRALVRKRFLKGSARGSMAAGSSCFYVIPSVVYFAVSFIFALIDTVLTISDDGISADISTVATLLLPYLELAVCSAAVFFLLRFFSGALEKRYSL